MTEDWIMAENWKMTEDWKMIVGQKPWQTVTRNMEGLERRDCNATADAANTGGLQMDVGGLQRRDSCRYGGCCKWTSGDCNGGTAILRWLLQIRWNAANLEIRRDYMDPFLNGAVIRSRVTKYTAKNYTTSLVIRSANGSTRNYISIPIPTSYKIPSTTLLHNCWE